MKQLTLLFTISIIIFTTINTVQADQPYEIWLENQWQRFDNYEKKCGPVARQLGKLDMHQLHFKGEWDDNNEDIRDQEISAIGGSIQTDILGSISGLFASSALIGLDIDEGMSLSEILDASINATQACKSLLEYLIKRRDQEWNYLCYYIDTHNWHSKGWKGSHNHGTPTRNTKYPDKEDFTLDLKINKWEFECGGGCGMSMDSPISTHLTNCNACEDDYHVCNQNDINWHGEQPCVKKVKVTEWIVDPKWGGTRIGITYRKCPSKCRNCKTTKAPHNITITREGSTILGKYTTCVRKLYVFKSGQKRSD